MSSSEILKASKRSKLGSRDARKLRAEGRVPATIQPEGEQQHLDIHFGEFEFLTARRHHVHLFDIDVDGTTETAVVRELQWDTFGQRIIHVEFKRVDRHVKTESEVEVAFEGHPKQGVVNHIVAHIPIRCLPGDIPDSLTVKINDLEEGDSIFARDVILPEGVELACEPDLLVASISAARGKEAEETEEGEEEPTTAEGEAPAPETPSQDS